MNVLRNLGPIEALRCVGVVPLGAHPPAAGPGHARGLHRRRASAGGSTGTSSRPTTRRCGASRRGDPGRLGRAADQEPLARSGGVGAAEAEAAAQKRDKSQQVTSLIEEFKYPKFGPGMMWETRADDGHGRGRQVSFDTQVTQVDARGRPAVSVTRSTEGVDHVYPCTTSSRRCRIGALLPAMDPPVAERTVEAAADAALPRLHHRRARRARGVLASPTTGSTCTTPMCRSAASRTSARGRRTW